LHLEGDKVSNLDLSCGTTAKAKESGKHDEPMVRKKVKTVEDGREMVTDLEKEREVPETPAVRNDITFGSNGTVPDTAKTMIFRGSTTVGKGLARAYPSINRLADSKSREPRKRMGTPPLTGSTDASAEGTTEIVDPDRAALTWHDDEITGCDPDDPDDDGEGINGIGFKPTPAIAYARMEKRRLQMAEYRNREAREARARRSERRRGEVGKAREEEAMKQAERKVRFIEGMIQNVIPTV
jgi:hypothetical protein